jgi:hypothetical protein
VTRDGRELRLFFNGRNVDNRNRVDPIGAAGYPTSPLIEAAGYAALRPDGIFGLRAGYGSTGRGEVVTKPLMACGAPGAEVDPGAVGVGGPCRGTRPHGWSWARSLLLNLDTGVGGEIRCELQDLHGHALPGFSLNESVPLTRNSLSARVVWRGPASDHSFATLPSAQPLRLRFTMEDAWLFAFHFE